MAPAPRLLTFVALLALAAPTLATRGKAQTFAGEREEREGAGGADARLPACTQPDRGASRATSPPPASPSPRTDAVRTHTPLLPRAAASATKQQQSACPVAQALPPKQASYFAAFYAAVDSSVFDGSQCGQCLAVTGPTGRTLVVRVVDECPSCAEGGLSLSPAAMQRLAGDAAAPTLAWTVVDCSTVGAKKAAPRPHVQVRRSRKMEVGA